MAKFKVQFNTVLKQIEISAGDDYSVSTDGLIKITNPSGVLVYKNAGYDSNDFSSPDIDSTHVFDYSLPLNSSGKIVAGDYIIDIKLNGLDFLLATHSATIKYCLEDIVPELDITYDCFSSSLTAKDNTDYNAQICGQSVEPVEKEFELTYSYPENIEGGAPADVVTTSSDTITISPIYTDNNSLKLETTSLIYQIPTAYVSNSNYEAFISTYVYGYDNTDVQCDNCICEMYSCIKKLMLEWMNSIGVNAVHEAKLRTQVIKLNALYNKYRIARECGNTDEVQDICSEITNAIDLYGCVCCDSEDDGYSTQVVAAGGSITTSGSGAEILFVAVDPYSALGNDGDIAIQTADGGSYLNGDVFKKISGSWVYQLNIIGDTGADGISSGIVIDSGYADEENITGIVTHDTISVELNGVNKLTDVGDKMTLWTGFEINGTTDVGSYIKLETPAGFDNITFDVEENTDLSWNVIVTVELRAGDNYDVAGTPLICVVSIKISNDLQGEYLDIFEGDFVGTSFDVVVKSNFTGGLGKIAYRGYDIKFNKAI